MKNRREIRDPRPETTPPLTHPSPLRGEGSVSFPSPPWGEGQGEGKVFSLASRVSRLASALLLCACIGLHACDKARSFDADFTAAESKVGLGESDGALAAYRNLADRYPNDPRRPGVLVRIADLYATVLHDDRQAIKAYGRIIRDYPLSEAAMVARERRAHLFEQGKNIDGAIEDYYALLKHYPTHADRHRYRVLLVGAYLAQRNFPQARIEVKALLDDPAVPAGVREQALFAAGESYFLEDKPEQAVPYYQQLLQEFPASPLASEAELHFATCVEEMGYLGTARDITRDAARDYPNQQVIDARLKSLKERGGRPVEPSP